MWEGKLQGEQEDAQEDHSAEEDHAAEDDDFGDDFDEFAEGGGDDDFGDFDEAEEAASHAPEEPQPVTQPAAPDVLAGLVSSQRKSKAELQSSLFAMSLLILSHSLL